MTIDTLVWLIPVPPILAFFLIVLFTNRNKPLSHVIAVGAAALSWLAVMVVVTQALQIDHLGAHPIGDQIAWLPTGDTWYFIGILVDPLTVVYCSSSLGPFL